MPLQVKCLPVDCDNDHSENPDDWVTPDDIMQAFPGVSFAIHYRLWMEIYQIVKENCATEYNGATPQDDVMERLLLARKGN